MTTARTLGTRLPSAMSLPMWCPGNGRVALYRWDNPTQQQHYYTTIAANADGVAYMSSIGYVDTAQSGTNVSCPHDRQTQSIRSSSGFSAVLLISRC